MTELTIGTDWGSYLAWNEQIQFNWDDLYNKMGVRFAVFRGDQEQISPTNGNYSTLRNLEASRRLLPINACFYWHYPLGSAAYYIDRYSRAIDREQPDFIGIDIEETSSGATAQQFSDTAQALCEGLQARYPEKRIAIYTRRDIVTSFSPQLQNWIGKFDLGWQAAWPDYGLAVYTLTWEQLAVPLVKIYPSGNLSTLQTTPWTSIPGWTANAIWQYSSRAKPPYPAGSLYAHTYDWNVFYGTVDEMKVWAKMTTPPAPPPTDIVERIKLLEANDKAQDARLTKLEAGLGRLVEIGDYVITQIKAFIAWLG